jgi:hypothetical protein
MGKRKTEMKYGVIDNDKERILFTLEIQPNFRINILRTNSFLKLTNSIEKRIC